ncbi:MAG TPA: hypothetical protein VF278_02385 [Pirellulales bacterium]
MKTLETTRGALLAALEELSRIKPEWRLGQILGNLATTIGRLDAGAVWELEDADALSAARALIEQYSDAAPDDAD